VLLAERGDLLTRLSRFPEAEADFGRAVRLEPGRDRGRLYAAAILELYLGDHSGYREQRRRAVEHFGNTTDPWVAETAAKIILLAPCEGEALRDAGGLIDRGLAARKGKFVPGFFRATKGMAEYRAGRYAEAVRWLADGRDAWDAAGGKVMAESYLAMAYQRAGNPAEASAALARSRARMDAELPRAGERDLLARKSAPFDWVTAQIAYREATALIDNPGADTRPAAPK
jgi:tetratricopeptide (TPR) repeat protein